MSLKPRLHAKEEVPAQGPNIVKVWAKRRSKEIIGHRLIDISPRIRYIHLRISSDTDAVREAIPDRGASAVPAGGLATRARAALGIIRLALRLGCEVLSLDWDRQGRVTPA
jgi:hypothetical protein